MMNLPKGSGLYLCPGFVLFLIIIQCCGRSIPLDDRDNSSLALPTFWDSHMVLQREPQSSVIWGWASPGANVSVTVGIESKNEQSDDSRQSQVVFSIVGDKGIWSVEIPPQLAGSGYSIQISDGHDDIVLEDIAFGDVYLCSGQSNMQMSVPATFNATAEIADSVNYPNLRLATVDLVTADTPQEDAPSKANYTWSRSSPKAFNEKATFEYYSATCYYFGRELYKHMDGKVPIGLVTSCWGGQTVETFSSHDALADKTCGGTRPELQSENSTHLIGGYSLSSDRSFGDGPKATQLWNAMINPLRRMRFTGVIWYQGEANAGNPSSYACRFPAMITDWRQKFNLPQLSFFFVQLAGYEPSNYEYIRAAQMAATQLPQVGYATAIDLGDPSSTSGSIHPRRKQEVGRRLSLAARSIQYNERGGLVYTGPTLKGVQIEKNGQSGSALRLSFEPGTADGLHLAGSPECKECCSELPFQVLDASGTWTRADDGKIRDSELFLASSHVDAVYGIRYAWEGYPQCILYNGMGGPDDHRGIASSPFEWCVYPSGSPPWTTASSCKVAVSNETSQTSEDIRKTTKE